MSNIENLKGLRAASMSAPRALLNSSYYQSLMSWLDSFPRNHRKDRPRRYNPWVDAGNIWEEQKAELPLDCYAAPVPKENKNRQLQKNLPPARPATKYQMQDNLHRHWLEMAQKHLIEN